MSSPKGGAIVALGFSVVVVAAIIMVARSGGYDSPYKPLSTTALNSSGGSGPIDPRGAGIVHSAGTQDSDDGGGRVPTALGAGAAPPPRTGVGSLGEFMASLDPNAKWNFAKTGSGRVMSMSGGFIKGYGTTPETALPLARDIANRLDVDPTQLQIDEEFKVMNKSPLSDVYNYRQFVQGYEVYGAYIRFFTRTSDDSIYFINNELRPIANPDLATTVDLTQAELIVRKQVQEKFRAVSPDVVAQVNFEPTSAKPFLFETRPGQGELAWRLVVEIPGGQVADQERDRREVLVSAKTGGVLLDFSLVVH